MTAIAPLPTLEELLDRQPDAVLELSPGRAVVYYRALDRYGRPYTRHVLVEDEEASLADLLRRGLEEALAEQRKEGAHASA